MLLSCAVTRTSTRASPIIVRTVLETSVADRSHLEASSTGSDPPRRERPCLDWSHSRDRPGSAAPCGDRRAGRSILPAMSWTTRTSSARRRPRHLLNDSVARRMENRPAIAAMQKSNAGPLRWSSTCSRPSAPARKRVIYRLPGSSTLSTPRRPARARQPLCTLRALLDTGHLESSRRHRTSEAPHSSPRG